MGIPPGFARDLALLSRALGGPTSLVVAVRALATTATESVPSYLGLSLVLHGPPSTSWPAPPGITLTTLPGAADPTVAGRIASSLLLPIVPAGPACAPGSPGPSGPAWRVQVVLYAANAGAFVDLAADLAWLAGTPLGEVEIDQHLRPQEAQEAQEQPDTPLGRASVVDQALGALLTQGFTAPQTVAELARRAASTDGDLVAAAEQLLLGLASQG